MLSSFCFLRKAGAYIEFIYGRGWDDVSMEEFMEMLDAYLVWYRDERRKSDLGYVSPMRYRRELGLAA